ncbi:MAG: Ig-like domain-containing protein, partial [Pseudomonadota bacterium]
MPFPSRSAVAPVTVKVTGALSISVSLANTLPVTSAPSSRPEAVSATPTAITDNGGTVLGTLTLNGDGSFSFDPAADYNGADGAALPVITYTLSDNDPVLPQTGTSTLAITIGAVNDAPDAVDDAATGSEDNTITVNAATGLLGNPVTGDTDLEGDGIAVTSITVGG